MKKILFTILLLGCPVYSHASTFVIQNQKSATVGDEVKVDVYINPEQQNVNAVSGELYIDPKKATIEKIINGNSAILFWIDGPTLNQKNNSIEFSGITPGGIESKSFVLSVILKLVSPGKIPLSIQNPHILKNDGKGTDITTNQIIQSLEVLSGDSHTKVDIEDTQSPERFIISIDNSGDFNTSNPVVIFATQDKGVGIDHYEYASTWILSPNDKDWKIVTSPAEITSHDIYKKIYIKAVDRVGNYEISTIYALKHYQLMALEVILSVLLLCVLYFIRRPSQSRS